LEHRGQLVGFVRAGSQCITDNDHHIRFTTLQCEVVPSRIEGGKEVLHDATSISTPFVCSHLTMQLLRIILELGSFPRSPNSAAAVDR